MAELNVLVLRFMKPKDVGCFTPIVWHVCGDRNSRKDPGQYSEIFDKKIPFKKKKLTRK